MADSLSPVTISPNGSNAWLVECADHPWFKERAWFGRGEAEHHATRHLKTYHGFNGRCERWEEARRG